MKKLLVAALAACTIIGSFATVSMAYASLIGKFGTQNRYNGSYYYDIGYVMAYSDGEKAKVMAVLSKNGIRASKTTCISNGTFTCWSGTIQGTGAKDIDGYIF